MEFSDWFAWNKLHISPLNKGSESAKTIMCH